jgi:hypothetical protein
MCGKCPKEAKAGKGREDKEGGLEAKREDVHVIQLQG